MIYIRDIKIDEELQVSEKWKSIEKEEYPEIDNIVIVIYQNGYGPIWQGFKITVAKYIDYYQWIDCLNATNTDLEPIYWREFPKLDE